MKPLSVLILLMASTVLVMPSSWPSQDTLKVSVDLVNVQFTVTDRRGRLVPGLKAQDFAVEEDGRKQEIRYFARENERPLTLALLVDTSPSVRPVFEDEKLTAVAFLESTLRPSDLALVIGFDRSVTLVQDYTDSVRSLKSAISGLEMGGGTSLYDAVYLACEDKLKTETGRKAIVLISDGEDTTSKVQFVEALIAAHRSDTVIYAISNSSRGFLTRRLGGMGDLGTLKKFAEETGGAAYVADGRTSFEKIFNQIAEELRTQYSLGYVSSNPARDGKFRKIRIAPKNSSYQIKARKGYYAAKDLSDR